MLWKFYTLWEEFTLLCHDFLFLLRYSSYFCVMARISGLILNLEHWFWNLSCISNTHCRLNFTSIVVRFYLWILVLTTQFMKMIFVSLNTDLFHWMKLCLSEHKVLEHWFWKLSCIWNTHYRLNFTSTVVRFYLWILVLTTQFMKMIFLFLWIQTYFTEWNFAYLNINFGSTDSENYRAFEILIID